MAWPDGRRGASARWSPSGPTCRYARSVRGPACPSGLTRRWLRSPGARGARAAGGTGPRDGGAQSAGRGERGVSRRRAKPPSAGCWERGPPVGRPRRPRASGGTCRPRPRWRRGSTLPIAATRSSRATRQPRRNGGGPSIRVGCGRVATDMRSRCCWLCAFCSGWSCGSAIVIPIGGAHATLFPPRPDRWRRALPAVHREVARWLRHQAVLWWVSTDRFMDLCSLRI
jgi:hypothetical protein